MRKLVLPGLAFALAAGCSSSSPTVRRAEAPANVTFPIAFGNYQRVYNTTYHVVNRYAVVKKASYRYGEIEAEVGQDNSFLDKTRRTILARIFDAGEYWDVECRVLLQVEDSEVESLNEHQPRYNWRTIASDSILETKLNNEVKAALSGGAWDAKQPLVPDSRAAQGPRAPRVKVAPAEDPEGEQGSAPRGDSERRASNLRDARVVLPAGGGLPALGEEEYERLGIRMLERGRWDRAAQAFRAARDSTPASPYASYLLAQALFATGDYSEAAQAIREGAARNPDWPRARLDLRGFYGDPKELREHVARLEGWVSAHADDGDARLVLGYVAYFTRDYARAEQVLEALTKERPADAVATTYKRLALVELDRARGLEEF